MSSTFLVSDVHGHLADLRSALTGAGLVDQDDRWLGGAGGADDLWVLGDLVDRGPDGIGVIRLLRSLQQQAPDRVRVLMGNHEALMLGERLFPGTRFSDLWLANGGRREDQEALEDDDVDWLRTLPVMARTGALLLAHSDTVDYLGWGASVEDVNARVGELVTSGRLDDCFDVFAALTSRFDFAADDGADEARRMLGTFGGDLIVHGHSIIGLLTGRASAEVTGPLAYADGLVLAIDGGRYDGGPLLLVSAQA